MWDSYAFGNYRLFCRELRDILDYAGADKVLFGTDNPIFNTVMPTKEYIQLIKDLPANSPEGIEFTKEEVDGILGGNAAKVEVLKYSQIIAKEGYVIGSGGNVSVLIEGEEALAITPSSIDYFNLTENDICIVGFDSKPVEGEHRPSIETGFHIAVYKNRLDVNAIIHTHQTFASVFTVLNRPIPALFDEQVLHLGNIIDVIPYGVSGSPDLVQNVVSKLDNDCNCYLLQNHGALCLGLDLAQALRNVKLLEKTAKVYYYALNLEKELTTIPKPYEDVFFGLLKNEQQKEIERKKDIKTK
ncbi:MAG: class II aldolase/adducin family protein [Deltaproteobacteria bacterium]|nr:class II aldolase/adducin family protein [Deltaproteobacteria bacterium]